MEKSAGIFWGPSSLKPQLNHFWNVISHNFTVFKNHVSFKWNLFLVFIFLVRSEFTMKDCVHFEECLYILS